MTATIEARGLVIRVLTDDLLFASGQATLEASADGLLGEIASLLNVDETHPISVEGNTDNVPIHSSAVPQQLGALDRAREHRRALPDRARRRRQPAHRLRQRRTAPG